MSQAPITCSLTKEEMTKRAKEYLINYYGAPNNSPDLDKWMERFGLLCAFIDEQFSSE